MKKNINKDQIIETALQLMKDKKDLRSLNLREIARSLGCAHTNIYNYFPSYEDLLWEVHITLKDIFFYLITDDMKKANNPKERLQCFFASFVNMYLDNTGWFRLAWQEYIGDTIPERNILHEEKISNKIGVYVYQICMDSHGDFISRKRCEKSLHIAHCYIIGEISGYISNANYDTETIKEKITQGALEVFLLSMGLPAKAPKPKDFLSAYKKESFFFDK